MSGTLLPSKETFTSNLKKLEKRDGPEVIEETRDHLHELLIATEKRMMQAAIGAILKQLYTPHAQVMRTESINTLSPKFTSVRLIATAKAMEDAGIEPQDLFNDANIKSLKPRKIGEDIVIDFTAPATHALKSTFNK